MKKRELMEGLERMIDSSTLNGVLSALVDVCNEKAQHIEENWQDSVTSKPWMRLGRSIERAQVDAYEAGI